MISPEKFRSLAAGLLSVTTAVALPFLGIWISKAIKDREVQGKFVELSVNILRDKPLGDETKALREWAVKVINQYSGISLPDDLISKTSLPYTGITNNAEKAVTLIGTFREKGGPVTLTIETGFAERAHYVVFLQDGTQRTQLCNGDSEKPFTCELPKPNAVNPNRKLTFQIQTFAFPDADHHLHRVSLSQDGSIIGQESIGEQYVVGVIALQSDQKP
jgi:hypothetical protein